MQDIVLVLFWLVDDKVASGVRFGALSNRHAVLSLVFFPLIRNDTCSQIATGR